MRMLILAVASLLMAGCATPYQESGLAGGFDQKRMEGDIWRVSFGGNGYTTRETAQTYWLYRCAELTLEQGFDGFEILSHIQLTLALSPEELFSTPRPLRHDAGGGTVFIPMYMDESHKPLITADIVLLKHPFEPRPPKIFDARELSSVLEPLVKNQETCGTGNVCPHVHKYLHPKEKFEDGGET